MTFKPVYSGVQNLILHLFLERASITTAWDFFLTFEGHTDEMHPIIRRILTFVLMFLGIQLSISNGQIELLDSLEKAANNADNIRAKVQTMTRLAEGFYTRAFDIERADSVYLEAIRLAEASRDPKLMVAAYQAFLLAPEHHCAREVVQGTLDKAISFAESITDQGLQFKIWTVLCEACGKIGEECSGDYADKLILVANNTRDLEKQIIANIHKGACVRNQKSWENAFSYLCKAELLILELDENLKPKYELRLNREMEELFFELGEYKQALIYNARLQNIVRRSLPVDSFLLNELKLHELEFSYYDNPEFPIKVGMDTLLAFARKRNFSKLKNYALSLYRTYLIERQDLKGIYSFYISEDPEALEKLRDQSTYHYFSIQAYIQEYLGKVDSATVLWDQALAYVHQDAKPFQEVHAHFRIGQFFARNGRMDLSLSHFEEALQFSKDLPESPYLETLLWELLDALQKIYESEGDYESANRYGKTYLQYDRLVRERMSRSLIEGIGAHEHELEDKWKEILEYQLKLKHNLQYWIILILVVASFILLIAFRSLRVPKWVIQMSAFFSTLAMVEFILILLDKQVMFITHGAPLGKFFIKVGVLTFLYPLHHLLEHEITEYMLRRDLLVHASWGRTKKLLGHLWPWLKEE